MDKDGKSRPEESRRLHAEIMCLSNLMRRRDETFGIKKNPYGLTNKQCFIIGFLAQNRERDIFQKDIEEEFSYRRSTASAVIGLMEEKGLIKRVGVPGDARLKKLVLTECSLKLVEEVDREIFRVEEQMRCGIDDGELEAFFTVLDKIKSNILHHPLPADDVFTNEGGNEK